MVAVPPGFALLRRCRRIPTNPMSAGCAARMAPVDIVLLDGFRRRHPKVEVVPSGRSRGCWRERPMVAGDHVGGTVTAPVPRVPLRDIGALGDFVLAHAMSGGAHRTDRVNPPTWVDCRRSPYPDNVRLVPVHRDPSVGYRPVLAERHAHCSPPQWWPDEEKAMGHPV